MAWSVRASSDARMPMYGIVAIRRPGAAIRRAEGNETGLLEKMTKITKNTPPPQMPSSMAAIKRAIKTFDAGRRRHAALFLK